MTFEEIVRIDPKDPIKLDALLIFILGLGAGEVGSVLRDLLLQKSLILLDIFQSTTMLSIEVLSCQ